MIAYLAGAVDAVSGKERNGWREQAATDLTSWGCTSYSPPHAFTVPRDAAAIDAERIIEINQLALDRSHFVLANLSQRSFGTPLEVASAREQHIPVFTFGMARGSIYWHRFRSYETYMDALRGIRFWIAEQEIA